MSHVLSLIAAGTKTALSDDDAARIRQSLRRAGTEVGAPAWLGLGEACDLPLQGDIPAALAAARSALAGRGVDVNVVPTAFRRKRLLIADMDSTLIEQECIDELAAEIGVGAEVAAITERAMRGEIAFEPALRERVGLLKGLGAAMVAKVLGERIRVMPGGATLVATMRDAGAHTVLVSGGFTAFAGPVARHLGFHEHHANELLAVGGSFTGAVAEPILGRRSKADTLRRLTRRLGLDPAETLAVGDGANDLDMIRLAGLGVAYRAKPALRDAAGALIDHSDLTALLYLQGIRRDDFLAPEGGDRIDAVY